MAWWNNAGDLWGDVKSIAQGKNPMNNNDAARYVPSAGMGLTNTSTIPGQPDTGQQFSTDTTMGDDGSSGGGAWDWITGHIGDVGSFFKDHAGDILKDTGAGVNAYLDYSAKQQALKQQKEQADRNYGLASNTQQMGAARALNAAPLVDKAMYSAQNFAAPTPFQPRDITKGVAAFQQPATGGAAQQVAANAAASANYKQGAGGYDTSTLKAILAKLQAPAPQTPSTIPQGVAPNSPAGTTRTIDYGGQQFSPQDWEAYKLKNNLQGYA